MIDVNTGASSRVSASATVEPTNDSAWNWRNADTDCSEKTIPTNVPTSATMRSEPTPTKSIASK